MSASHALLLSLLGVSACALHAEVFEERYLEAFCEYQETCDPPLFTSEDRCYTSEAMDREELVDCAFDPEAGRACLRALSGLECRGAAVNFPAECHPEATHDCGTSQASEASE